MTRQLRDLPRREVAEDLRGAHAQLVLQRVDFGVHVHRGAVACMTQFLDLRFQVGDGLLEIEVVRVHWRRRAGHVKARWGSVAHGPGPYRGVRIGMLCR